MQRRSSLQVGVLALCSAIAGMVGAVCGNTALAAVNSWSVSGPPGGSLKRLIASSSDNSILYAAVGRSLHKSSDGGETWRTIRDFYGETLDVAVSPTNPNTVLVGVEGSGLYRSVDGGETFQLVAQFLFSPAAIAITSTYFYYAAEGRFYRSTDNGLTWTSRSTLQSTSRLIAHDSDPNLVYAFDNRGGSSVVRRSVDGGATWSSTSIPGVVFLFDLIASSTGALVAATSQGAYVLASGGTTWSRTLNCECFAVAVDPLAPSTLMISVGSTTSRGRLFRSVDGGTTWTEFSVTPYGAAEAIVFGSPSPNTVLLANSAIVQRSTDGVTWTEVAQAPVGVAEIRFTPASLSTPRLFVFSQREVSFSHGLFELIGSSWRRLNLLAAYDAANAQRFIRTTVAVKPGDPNTIFLSSAVGLVRSQNGGATWQRLPGPYDGGEIVDFEFDPVDPNVLYVVVIRFTTSLTSVIYRSTNNGSSWTTWASTAPGLPFFERLVKDPANPLRVFAIRNSGDVVRSTDGGQSWNVVLSNQTINGIIVNAANSNDVYVATSEGIQISADGGATFSFNYAFKNITNRGARAMAVDPVASDTLYVATYGPDDPSYATQRSSWVLRSVDKGQSWEVLRTENDAPTWRATDIVADPSNPALVHVATGFRGVASFEIATDLAASLVGHSGSRPVGGAASFDIRVQNFGQYAATQLRVTTAMPANVGSVSASSNGRACSFLAGTLSCDIPFLRAGESATIRVNYTATSDGALPVTTTVSALQRELSAGNNVHAATATAVEVVDLGTAIAATASVVNIGEALGFTVRAVNNGPSNLSAGELTFTAPAGVTLTAPTGCALTGTMATCAVGALTSSATRSFTFNVQPNSSGTVTVQAVVSADSGATESNLTNNTAILSALVRPEGDVSIAVSDSADPVVAGNIFDYRVVVRNNGPESMPNVVATLTRTGGVASTVTSTRGGCASASGALRCDFGALETGATAVVVMTVSSGGQGTVSLQASTVSDGNDRTSANNVAQESTSVQVASTNRGGGALHWSLVFVLLSIFALRRRIELRKVATIAIASIGLVASAEADFNTWTITGPPGGYIRNYAGSDLDDNVMYVLLEQSLHRSTDGGNRWETVAYFDTWARDFALDPTNSNRVYVVVGQRGVYRSDDGGKTLTRVAVSTSELRTVGVSGATVYRAADDKSFFRSTDRGQTWTQRGPTIGVMDYMYVDRNNPDLIIGYGGPYQQRSVNGGASWTQSEVTSGVPFGPFVFKIVRSGPALVAATTSGMFASNDDGATWARTNVDWQYTVAVDPSSPGTVIAGTAGYGLLTRSTNNGSTWSQYGTLVRFPIQGLIVSRQASRMVVLSNHGTFVSNNGGASWSDAAVAPVSSFAVDMAIARGSDPKVFALRWGDSDLFHTTQNAGWHRVNLFDVRALMQTFQMDLSLIAINPSDANVMYLGSRREGLFKSINGGNSWTRGTNPNGLSPLMIAFDPSDPQVSYAYAATSDATPTQAGGLFRSTNGGTTWTLHSTNLTSRIVSSMPRFAIDPTNPQRFYLGSLGDENGAGLHRSMDGGVNWQTSLAPHPVYGLAVHPLNGTLHVAGWNGLYTSTDAGGTFITNTRYAAITDQRPSAVVIDPVHPNTMYVASAGYSNEATQPRSSFVLRSVDGGQSWETLRGEYDTPSLNIDRLILDPKSPGIIYASAWARGVASFEVAPDLSVAVSGHSGERVVGQDSSFDLRATNLGPFAANNVRLDASMPTGASITSVSSDRAACTSALTTVSCSLGLMHVGVVANVHVTYHVTGATALPVTATVVAHERSADPTHSTVTALAYSGQVADLQVTALSAVPTAHVGETVSFPVQVRNAGPTASSNATLTFTPGANQILGAPPFGCAQSGNTLTCDVGSLPPSGATSFTFRTVAQGIGIAAVGLSIVPSSTTIDPDATNNTATASAQVRPHGDLSVSISDTADPVQVGANVEYRAIIRNAGPDSLPNVSATVANSGNTITSVASTQGTCTLTMCNMGALASGASITITIVANSNAAGFGSMRVVVDTEGDDTTSINDSAREFTTINAPPATSSSGGSTGTMVLYGLSALVLLRRRRLRRAA